MQRNRYAGIGSANFWANVTLIDIPGECDQCPHTPAKGQTVLILPCVKRNVEQWFLLRL
jgi:hypothetical protein